MIPAEAELTAAPRRDPGLGRHARRPQAGAGPADGGLRRLPGAHRPPRRPADRRARRARDPRRHARLLHHRRQRRLGRGHAQRRLQRDGQLQRHGRARDAGVHGSQDRRASARPSAYNHYSVGWAYAMDTPYQWTKQVASHWGGTRNGTIVHWPNGIEAKGGLRAQFTHVIDVAPTVLEAAGLPEPTMVNGVQQAPIEGMSMVYSFDDADAAERHDLQYFEMFGNRGIYHKGWSAVTKHTHAVGDGRRRRCRRSTTTSGSSTTARSDCTQAHDLAAEQPEQAARAAAAVADRGGQVQRAAARRPHAPSGSTRTSPAGRRSSAATRRCCSPAWAGCRRTASSTSRTSRSRSPPRSTCPTAAPTGVIIAQGGRFGGWALYAKDGTAWFVYNLLGIQRVRDRGRRADPGRARTRCGWSSPTTAAGSPRAATSPSTTTASRSARAGWRPPSR